MQNLKNYLFIPGKEDINNTRPNRYKCAQRSKVKDNTWQQSISSLLIQLTLIVALQFGITLDASAQHKDKPRPEAWNNLVYGGRFMDRILPAPVYTGLECFTWGTREVRPRDIHNGIEDTEWSYWGGKPVLGDDGKYHFFGCRWPEDAECVFGSRKMALTNSIVCRM
ncbi:MAG: hypothetical protein ACQESL_09690 [Bacteroidota bacterium]